MAKKTLLLNSSYEVVSFIVERKAIKLYLKEKAEVLASWEDEKMRYGSGYLHLPAILKLKNYVKSFSKKMTFSRKALIKRDNSICQYCNRVLNGKEVTMDHIIPKSLGGKSSFMNCVASCFRCNSNKGNKTLEQAGMKLLHDPYVPVYGSINNFSDDEFWHKDWDLYLKLK